MGRTQQIASFSIVLGAAALVLEMGAWWLTGSAALFANALETAVNLAAAIIARVARHVANRPADANHPYGHEKAEFFAAVVEGALIILASFTILTHAFENWRHPAPIAGPWAGLALTALATLLNAIWAVVLSRTAKQSGSTVLAAEGRALWMDVVTSIAVIAGVSLAVSTRQGLIDTALAALVAAHVLWSGLRLVSASVGGLMDAAPPAEITNRIRRLVGEHAYGALEAHDLRTRHAGRLTYLEFHLVVPGHLTVSDAHDICDRIESALREDMEHLVITIHVEPEAKAKHQGVLVL